MGDIAGKPEFRGDPVCRFSTGEIMAAAMPN